MERRKNIALFVAMVENEISYAVCEGALLAAKEMDANLYIMPVGMIDAAYDDVEANCYRYQYATMLSCAQFKDIDAVVMEYGSITSCIDQAKKNEILQQIGDVPVVLLAGEKEGYSSICMDNSIGIQHAVNHLVKQQNCKKIGFISGPIETSQDARERLEAYKTAMIANGIPMEEDWIAYGNFSEYSEEVVEALLIKHPDMEGLVFANDQMAIGGYHVMRKMGLEPGKDILVTGFDDSSVATSLEPSLTSVKSDSKEMAYRAVLACESVMRGEVVHEFVHSHLMVRESSNVALNDDNEVVRDRELPSLDKELIQDIKDKLCEKYLNVAYTTSETVRMREIFEKYFNYYIHLVNQDGTLALQEEEFINQYNEFSLIYRNGYIDMSRFFSISNSLHECLNRLVKSEEERLRLLQAVIAANHAFMNEMTKQKVIEADTNKNFEIILTCVTRDMLQSSEEEKKKYQTVITKLQKLNFASGYIYTYGNGIVHSKGEKWNSPEWLYLKGYHNGDDIYLYKGKEKRIKTNSIFATAMLPRDRRFDILVMPLFSGEEQYGFLLAETRLEHFHYASQIASQVSVSIEVLEIIKKQNAIKKALEKSLAQSIESNRVLDEMSRSDHLTGIQNRRGFMNTTRHILADEKNFGKKAIAVYADMDNLKIINDEFGHDEGDYSLKVIAQTLVESFRQSDVIGRMGGDEFAAFAIVNQENFPEMIRTRIHSVLERLNDNDKAYYIDMSVGIAEFIIGENSDIERILSEADADLYAEKRNKKKVVYKSS